MKSISALALGGTLFVPATHKHLTAIAKGEKYPFLRSVVIDLEDGIADSVVEDAMGHLQQLLGSVDAFGPHIFIRARDPKMLAAIQVLKGIEKSIGFVLPKFGLENADAYLELLSGKPFLFMPSIEGRELFDLTDLQKLRTKLLPFSAQIPLIRFGAEDMLRQLGIRRECTHALLDMAAPSGVVGNLLMTFRPYGFHVSAPVYPCYKDREGFMAEVKRELREGLVSKTVIHPDQAQWFETCYRVDEPTYEEAKRLLDSGEAVFGDSGKMAETKTQSPWAEMILQRASLYGRV